MHGAHLSEPRVEPTTVIEDLDVIVNYCLRSFACWPGSAAVRRKPFSLRHGTDPGQHRDLLGCEAAAE